MRGSPFHTPVLLDEVLRFLFTTADGVYVDATLGGGGHAESLLLRLSSTGRVIGLDADADAIEAARVRLSAYGDRVTLLHRNFEFLQSTLAELKINSVAGVFFDLGVSSFQLDAPGKGFSFRADERLDLRMDRSQSLDARTVVNEYREKALADVIWRYGEERASRRIAAEIVRRRQRSPIETTAQLAAIIEHTVGERFVIKSLARVFQALRIEVNKELERLRHALVQAMDVVQRGGRIVVISYHSLEDRIVKETFKQAAASFRPSGNKLVPDTPLQPTLKILTRKPIEASDQEKRNNPRARSAKLRAAERI